MAAHGLKPGIYRVAISSPLLGKPIGSEEYAKGIMTAAKERIPPNYNAQSTLTAEVTPDKNCFDFNLP